MAKKNLTLDEKIRVVQKAIAKEETAIKTKRDKLMKLRQDLQKLEKEKAQLFTDELMQIVGDCGIVSEEQKQELIKMVKNAATDLSHKWGLNDNSANSKTQNSKSELPSSSEKSASSFSDENPAGETNDLTRGQQP
jgi:hypothetical protein